jgi:hypothetical protein
MYWMDRGMLLVIYLLDVLLLILSTAPLTGHWTLFLLPPLGECLAQAAIKNHHRLGDYSNRHLSQFWMLDAQNQGACRISSW